MIDDDKVENVIPIVRLIEAVRDVVKRDVNLGLYEPETLRLTVEARKEVVKKLADEGLSTRQIGTIVGVSHTQVSNDLATNLPKSGNKLAKSDRIEEAKAKVREEVREAHEKEIADLQEQLKNIKAEIEKDKETLVNSVMADIGIQLEERDKLIQKQKEQIKKQQKQRKEAEENLAKLIQGPPPTDFAKEIGQLTGPLVKFIQHDNLVNMLIELESQKENRVNDWDMPELERVIHALLSLSKRAQSWAERLTPMNEKWNNRIHSYFKEGTTL